MRRSIIVAVLVVGVLVFGVVTVSAFGLDELNAEKWREDLDYLVGKLKEIHPNMYARISGEEFEAARLELYEKIPTLEKHEIVVGLIKIAALLRDGHTGVSSSGPNGFPTKFPLRTYMFSDGLFITVIAKEHEDLVGAKVLRYGSLSGDEAFKQAGTMRLTDNEFFQTEYACHTLTYPHAIKVLGINDSLESLTVEAMTRTGEKKTVTLTATDKNPNGSWFWRPLRSPAAGQAAIPFAGEGETMPRHLDYKKSTYWFEHMREHDAVYMQFSAVQNYGDETFREFYRRMFKYIDENNVNKLIIDIRYNGGGNGDMLFPFIYEIIKRDRINKSGNLFVIMGRKTFSAAIMAAARIQDHTNVILVGEPAGAGMNHYGDASGFRLPNSKLPFYVSTLYWQEGHPADFRNFFAPDMPAVFSSDDFFDGRDPAMDIILSGKAVSLAYTYESQGLDAALERYYSLKKQYGHIDWWKPFSESDINGLGYALLRQKKVGDAIKVFTLNAEVYPDSWNVWDSLAEAYMTKGDNAMATKLYNKSLELNPGNSNAREMLARISNNTRNKN